jgi:hypothetical protein
LSALDYAKEDERRRDGLIAAREENARLEKLYLEMRDGHEHVCHQFHAEEEKLKAELLSYKEDHDAGAALNASLEKELAEAKVELSRRDTDAMRDGQERAQYWREVDGDRARLLTLARDMRSALERCSKAAGRGAIPAVQMWANEALAKADALGIGGGDE